MDLRFKYKMFEMYISVGSLVEGGIAPPLLKAYMILESWAFFMLLRCSSSHIAP